MKRSELHFESELQISPKVILAGLIFFGLMLIFAGDYLASRADSFRAAHLGVLIVALAMGGWFLSEWRLNLARGGIIIVVSLIIFIGISWLESPVFLTLVVIPVAVAAIVSGSPVATITALGESVLLFLLPLEIDLGSRLIILLAIWAMMGVILALYYPLYEITHWSWVRFRQAQELLEETRNRKVELRQALDDLAHAYRELALLNERVTAMRLIAEEAQAAKTAFVAKVSHEFRTPLNMIIGLTDVLIDTPEVYGEALSTELLEDLTIVHRNCEHLSKMVNDILDLSRTEMGHLTLHREWASLTEDIETALMVVCPLLDKKHLTLQVNVPADLPQIHYDRIRIRQVILNLVSNAARFTMQGGITVSVHRQEQHVVIEVTDTGPGILPEDAQRIFEPFYQGGGNPWRDQTGTGLGLSISKQFVELHSGQMWLESEPGVGSTFSFQLPMSLPTSPAATPARWISQEWVWHERTSDAKLPSLPYNQRVLICDDSDDLCHLMTDCSDQIEFIKVDNLSEAVQEAQTVPAHVVIVNRSSNGSAEPLIEQARIDLPDTPIIVGTFPSRTKRVVEAGAINYLIKPIKRVDLEEAIRAVVQPVNCVLIADDDPDLQQLLKRMLWLYDPTLEIMTASSGEQALTQLRLGRPDLMLIDIAMPDMNGWQTLEQKQQDATIKDIPTIILSAQDPASQPMISQTLSVTFGPGLTVDKFLRCSLELSALFLEPN